MGVGLEITSEQWEVVAVLVICETTGTARGIVRSYLRMMGLLRPPRVGRRAIGKRLERMRYEGGCDLLRGWLGGE